MKIYMKLLTLLITFPMLSAAEDLPELGDALPLSAKRKTHAVVRTSPDRRDDLNHIAVRNITFALAVDSSNRVVYILTTSTEFTTSDGVRIGTTLTDVKALGNTTEITKPNGAYFFILPSGWNAVFAHGTKHSKAPIPPTVLAGAQQNAPFKQP